MSTSTVTGLEPSQNKDVTLAIERVSPMSASWLARIGALGDPFGHKQIELLVWPVGMAVGWQIRIVLDEITWGVWRT